MSNIFLTADWHISHRNTIIGVSSWTQSQPFRQFDSVEEMNNTIIGNLNEFVGEQDILYNLGDVGFGRLKDLPDTLSRIRCKNIHLIYGNHDRKSLIKKDWARQFFKTIQPYYELKYNKKKIVLCHYAFRVWNQHHKGSYHAFGHSHGHLPGLGRSMDVGVDCHNYRPISLDWFLATLSKNKSHILDHHKDSHE